VAPRAGHELPGLVTRVRKMPRLQVRNVQATRFVKQQGDSMKLLNRRGFLAIELRLDRHTPCSS
jgi:hypothetical protein